MPCYHPIAAYQKKPGARLILGRLAASSYNLHIPCGKCIGCRADKATEWGNRCQHEASRWRHCSFITLTYDDSHLPTEGWLDSAALQKFVKRLRKAHHRVGREPGPLKFIACGEYGSRTARPHYHLLLFNCGFPDLQRAGKDTYTSKLLADLWPYGTHKIGIATPGRCANYIAKYTLKHDSFKTKSGNGEVDSDGVWRPRPFLRMSNRPAIGFEWVAKHHNDLQHGYLLERNMKQKIPRYYRKVLQRINPELTAKIIQRIHERNTQITDKNEPNRLKDQELIHQQLHERKQRNNFS